MKTQTAIQTLILFASFLLATTISYSQRFDVGVQTGLTRSYLQYGEAYQSEKVSRLRLSAVLEYNPSARWSWETGFGYIGRGGGDFNDNIPLFTGSTEYQIRTDYLNVFILPKFHFIKEAKLRPFIALGSNFAYGIGAKDKDRGDTLKFRDKFDLVLMAVGGLKFKISENTTLEFQGGYERATSKALRVVSNGQFNTAHFFALSYKQKL